MLTSSVCDGSRRILEGKADRTDKPTYERLYDLNKEKKQKNENEQTMRDEQSKVEKSRMVDKSRHDVPLQDALYNDAAKRKENIEAKRKELDKTRDKPKEDKYKNDKSEKYVAQKLIKKFESSWQEVEAEDCDEKGSHGRFSDMEFRMLLNRMGFANLDGTRAQADGKLLDKLWEVAKGEDNGGISKDTAKVLCLSIMDLAQPSREVAEGDEHESPDRKSKKSARATEQTHAEEEKVKDASPKAVSPKAPTPKAESPKHEEGKTETPAETSPERSAEKPAETPESPAEKKHEEEKVASPKAEEASPAREESKSEHQESPARDEDQKVQEEEEKNRPQVPKFGWFDEDGFYFIIPGKAKKFFNYFYDLYVNYVQQYSDNRKAQANSESISPPKPYVSDKSSKIAAERRKKLLGDNPDGKKADIVSILLQPTNTKEKND